LKNEQLARQIVDSLRLPADCRTVLEVGPGSGILTRHLLAKPDIELYVMEVDERMTKALEQQFPQLKERILNVDFLKCPLTQLVPTPFAIIGNFPYNISSQIIFRVIDHRDAVREVVGMFQREVAVRIAARPGSKAYGVISVFTQLYYEGEYVFEVGASEFRPPPKVQSAVIRLRRNQRQEPDCNEALFKRMVKTAFGQRRKMLRNSLKTLIPKSDLAKNRIFARRPEQLGLEEWMAITRLASAKASG